MPTLTKKLTDTVAKSEKDCPTPASGYTIYWCEKKDGFGLRVSWTGDRAWVKERRVAGKTVRRTLGKAAGRGAISSTAARELALDISSELAKGVDRSEIQRDARKADALVKQEILLTFGVALKEYVEQKRRGKDGLALKERTKQDYLSMIEQGRTRLSGKPMRDGALFSIKDKPLAHLTADDMRDLYADALSRGTRQAVYCMQVLRAVLNWHGAKVPDNPLSKDVAGRKRIVLAQTKGKPNPIRPEYLGAWYRAACKVSASTTDDAGDYLRFQLLTGCRGVEIKGDAYDNEPIKVKDVDLTGARIVLRDTKNRADHALLLSSQALEIVKRNITGKKPNTPLFAVNDARDALHTINAAAGLDPAAHSGHDLRATFASVAEELVSSYTLKRMLNHSEGGDVTGGHYIEKSETQLRAGWQAVADFIELSTAT
jgi:integrase